MAYSWPTFLGPYVKNTQIFRCPSQMPSACAAANASLGITNAYGINYDGVCLQMMARIDKPAERMLIQDMQDWFVISSTNLQSTCLTAFGSGLQRHNDGANVVFCDGHAKWLAGSTIKGSIPGTGVWCEYLGITMQ